MSEGLSPFRPLAPSRRGAMSNSAAEYEQSSPAAGDQAAQDSDNGQSTSGADHAAFLHRSRKRRAPAHVSQNACTNCKKARSKCDGVEPASCSRCVDRGVECQYEVHIKTAKEEMMRRIKDLEHLNRTDKEKITYLESFIQALASNDQGPEAIARLRQGQTLQQVADFLNDPRYQSMTRLSPTSEKHLRAVLRHDQNLGKAGISSSTESISRWSQVALPAPLKEHLVRLYITWFHPIYMLFSQKHFVASLNSNDSIVARKYCTSSMVNLMCAIGCTMLVDPNDVLGPEAKHYQLLFLTQALADLKREDETKPTWAISYALLFLLELCTGQARKASSHLRAAVESLARLDRSDFNNEAFEVMSWGIHTLTTTWAGFTYVKPHNPASTRAAVFQSVQPELTPEPWHFYRYPGDEQQSTDQAARQVFNSAIQTAKEAAKLNQVIHETMNVYCGSRGKVTGASIMVLYNQFTYWNALLPQYLPNHTNGPLLPHNLFLRVHYCTAICQLFQPLLSSNMFPPGTQDLLRDIILRSAREGLDLLHSFGATYTHRYHTPMQLFCLVHLGDILLQAEQNDVEAAIRFVLSALHDAQHGLAIAGPLAAMFSQRVEEKGFQLPDDLAQRLAENLQRFGNEEKLDTCERVTYAQPVDQLISRLDPAIAAQFEREWQLHMENRGLGGPENVAGVGGMAMSNGTEKMSPGESEDSLSRRSSETTAAGTARRQLDVSSLINP